MYLAQGPQGNDASEARTRSPSVSSQALYHWGTALPIVFNEYDSGTLQIIVYIFKKPY